MLVNTAQLQESLAQFGISVTGITGGQLQQNSLYLNKGDVFVAVPGANTDGRDFIDHAIAKGAVAIITHTDIPERHGLQCIQQELNHQALVIEFYQLRQQLSQFSAAYYQQPAQQLKTVGVTGTNGKTSTVHFIAQLISQLGSSSATIGTLGYGLANVEVKNTINTTPGPIELQQVLAEFVNKKVQLVAMEVSSHALDQQRVQPESIDIAIFTNLSRDHLDYHQTMEAYANCKKQLFVDSKAQTWVLNIDDGVCQQWLSEWQNSLASQEHMVVLSTKQNLSEHQGSYIYADNIQCLNNGTRFQLNSSWGNCIITSQLIGEFNVSNLLSAIAVALVQKFTLAQIQTVVANIKPVAGRMEVFSAADKAMAIVDYAHTPDALEQALVACRRHCEGELSVVFGCGGDRDKGKRVEMGAVAQQLADQIIITNDNPRTELPQAIANDIMAACPTATCILDREQAVLAALNSAAVNDVVLLAGKGHEDYLIIGEERINYNERALVQKFYQGGQYS